MCSAASNSGILDSLEPVINASSIHTYKRTRTPSSACCRFSLYFFGKAFMAMCGCCCKESHTSTLYEEVTYEAALLVMHAQSGNSGAGHSAFADATVALAGAPTYRLPHHPRYSEIFHNPLYKPVWFKAFGRLRYTTLVSCCAAPCCGDCVAVLRWLRAPWWRTSPPCAAAVTTVLSSPTAAVPPWWRVYHRPGAHPGPRPDRHGAEPVNNVRGPAKDGAEDG